MEWFKLKVRFWFGLSQVKMHLLLTKEALTIVVLLTSLIQLIDGVSGLQKRLEY
jgi:hypothetical protein